MTLRSFSMAYIDLLKAQVGTGDLIVVESESVDVYRQGSTTWPFTQSGTPEAASGVEGNGWKALTRSASSNRSASNIIPGKGVEMSGWFKMTANAESDFVTLWKMSNSTLGLNIYIYLVPPGYGSAPFAGQGGIQFVKTAGSTTTLNHAFDIADGNWHHIAVTTQGVHLDGTLVISTAITMNAGTTSTGTRNWLHGSLTPAHALNNYLTFDNFAFYPSDLLNETMITEQSNYFANADKDYAASPATASALMNSGTFSFSRAISVTAESASASALATEDHIVIIPEVRRMLSPATYFNGTLATGQNVGDLLLGSNNALVEVPMPEDGIIHSKTFRMFYPSTAGGYSNANPAHFTITAGYMNGSTYVATSTPLPATSTNRNNARVINVPFDATHLRITATAGGERIWIDNPANDISAESYFTVQVEVAPTTRIEPLAATAEALAVEPAVSIHIPANVFAELATAGADMPGGYYPDAEALVEAFEGASEMRTAWFRSDRTVAAESISLEASMASDSTVLVDRNIEVLAEAALARNGRILNPLEVDENVNDPYWNRVVGRSADGTLPPRNGEWYRFNERAGAQVHRHDLTTGAPLPFNPPASGGVLEGVFERGILAPNGKRGVAITAARMNVTFADTYYSGTLLGNLGGSQYLGTSLEFTLRVAPGQTGRMDIANGSMDHVTNVGNAASRIFINVGVRDGKIYAAERAGGTSMKRIDDGLWHHVVITPGPGYRTPEVSGTQYPIQIWIDGMLDRTLRRHENNNGGAIVQGNRLARPDAYFGDDTGYPFKGEITELIARSAPLNGSQITDLYLDMFGYTAVRVGMVGAATAAMGQDSKVESNMKRMLVLSWNIPVGQFPASARNADRTAYFEGNPIVRDSIYTFSIEPEQYRDNPILSTMMAYGSGYDVDTAQYLLTYQSVQNIWTPGVGYTAVSEDALARLGAGVFRNLETGEPRLINLQTDIDLNQFDIIAFQAYPNPVHLTQRERLMYEDFLNSVNQALVDGHKLWVTDPALAADLGWVSDIDEVPVLSNMGTDGGYLQNAVNNDVRAYEIAPWIGLHGQKMPKPTDGSIPELPTGKPEWDIYGAVEENIWDSDLHMNNGYRVVNEIPGLTDIPGWEVEEAFHRDRQYHDETGTQHAQWGWKLRNLSGVDWVSEEKVDGTNEPALTLPSERRGLRVGDEAYDWLWIVSGMNRYRASYHLPWYMEPEQVTNMRTHKTWAVAPGGLRVGAPVSTFRTHMWNDFGDSILNPYRNHIRNFVIQPGDRLSDGRKIRGYAFADFSEKPVFGYLSGRVIPVQARGTEPAMTLRPNMPGYVPEDEYSFQWDYLTHGRQTYGGGGVVTGNEWDGKLWHGTKMETADGAWAVLETLKTIEAFHLPLAETRHEVYKVFPVAHYPWNTRGVAWLTYVGTEDADVTREMAAPMVATAAMAEPHVEVEFDLTVGAATASASARIIDPGETVIKSTTHVAFVANATGMMNGRQGGYMAQAAVSFGNMPQNVRRPLDITEVLFFTLTYSQEPIYLRMEEN